MIDRSHGSADPAPGRAGEHSCGSAYYKARPVSECEGELMRRVDGLHLKLPFAGARMSCDLLRGEGVAVGRKHMTKPMRRMAITALYRKPDTRKKAPGRTIYPYLLRTLSVTRANQVWAMDISFHPDGPRLRLLGRGHRLVQPQGASLAGVDLDGRQGLLARQRVHRAAVALHQVRGGVPACP